MEFEVEWYERVVFIRTSNNTIMYDNCDTKEELIEIIKDYIEKEV